MSNSPPPHSSNDSSEQDEPVYQPPQTHAAMASSWTGLGAVTSNGASHVESTEEGKPQSGQLKDFLDLATGPSAADISARLEQKRLEHERQRELQKKAFEEQMKQLELQQEREERELLERAQLLAAGGSLPPPSASSPSPSSSSPTDASALPSSTGPTSTGGPVRSRSGTDLTSFGGGGVNEFGQAGSSAVGAGGGEGRERRRLDYANAKSMPGSRRHSGEFRTDAAVVGAEGARRGASTTGGRDGEPLLNSFLFDDELEADLQNSAWGGKYLQMNTDDDKFPILVRRDSYPGILSASSAALDLAPLSQTPSHAHRNFSGPTRAGASEWPQFQSNITSVSRSGETASALSSSPNNNNNNASNSKDTSVSNGASTSNNNDSASPSNNNNNNSNSINPSGRASPRSRGPIGSSTGIASNSLPPPRSSLGGVGAGTNSGRNSPTVEKKEGGQQGSKIGGAGAGYGNELLSGVGQAEGQRPNYVDGLTDQFSNFNIDSAAFGSDPSQGPFGGYGDHGTFSYDGSAAGAYGSVGANRFAGLRLEDLQGDMLPLCKDQFGCRYLQKKLEDGNPEHRDMIFNEIFPHFAELMTDPFANYLSQRLLEYSTDEQRDALIDSISGELVSISLNMHGTRAVQKMIDYLSTQRQVQSLILALNLNVVTLIKDLNGNHVIQKCLNHLPPEDNQFIYNAVATHCIEVATHRHGCCVLQRCIDHASESQRIQLVTEITYNSLTLVQDAFGNYVVQYVLDLNDNRFIEAIVRQFLGNVSALSAQKFSSNVVEKCIRVADASGRRAIIDELLNKQRLERLLRDSFANYVVQTALDYAEPAQRAQLIETIRPILPMIRNTPYGKRIQSKIQRETSDHMSRSGYHPALVPGGQHFYGLQHPPPHQYLQHPGQYGPPMGSEYGGRSPYMGYQNQGPPPPLQHQQQGGYQQPPHQQHLQNGSISGPQFAPFPGVIPSMGIQDYQQVMPGMGNAYPGFM